MSYETNNIQINDLTRYTSRASNDVLSAIKGASRQSGVDFSYLIKQAAAESNFNPNADAKTSSASGLYQFIDATWLTTIERYGEDYGLDTTGKSKSEILDMRKDPKAASFMAAAFATENEQILNNNWGGDVGSTELYFAHFLGAGGASSFLNARDENPLRPAADLFPAAAKANRNVFYDKDTGKPRTLEQVYQFFDKKFQVKGNDVQIDIAATKPEQQPSVHKAYGSITRQLSDGIIMQRAQAMREAASQNYGHISDLRFMGASNVAEKSNAPDRMPFFSLISKPVDLMMLTQTMPNKVLRDKL